MTPLLHHLRVGTAGARITFCHGLFGQGRNWHQIAKALSGPNQDRARCLLLDLPDHGRSPWSMAFSVDAYADAVAFELRRWNQGEPGVLVGHSLGGKVAMLVALAHPDLVRRLAVVDIAPRHYRAGHWYLDYIAAMKAIPLEHLSSRSEADRALAETVPDPTVRAFLLQNLRQHRRQVVLAGQPRRPRRVRHPPVQPRRVAGRRGGELPGIPQSPCSGLPAPSPATSPTTTRPR